MEVIGFQGPRTFHLGQLLKGGCMLHNHWLCDPRVLFQSFSLTKFPSWTSTPYVSQAYSRFVDYILEDDIIILTSW